MELTDKCKVEFEKWLKLQPFMTNPEYSYEVNKLPEAMQYGVLVDYFLETLKKDLDKLTVYYTKGYGKSKARVKAVEEFNDFYNELKS